MSTDTLPQTTVAPDPASTDLLLKVLRSGGTPPMADTTQRWSLPTRNDDGTYTPGEWWTVTGKLVACKRGLHLCRVIDLPNWILNADEVYVVEHDGELIVHGDETSSKIVVRKARLLAPSAVPFVTDILRGWAADCAEHVLHICEQRYPDDRRPREAIEAARAYIRGEIDKNALFAARDRAWKARKSAAYAAADAAYAAADAAYAAADAAYAAAYAAADAAYAAYAAAAYAAAYAADAADAADARKHEKRWQTVRLATLLGLPGYAEAQP